MLDKCNIRTRELIRFCVVGIICTAIDAGIYYGLKRLVDYRLALISAYCLSLIVNYLLTVFWTFKTKPTVVNALGIVVAHLFNLFVIRMGMMYFFVHHLKLSDNVAYWPVLIISVVINFVMIRFVVNKFK